MLHRHGMNRQPHQHPDERLYDYTLTSASVWLSYCRVVGCCFAQLGDDVASECTPAPLDDVCGAEVQRDHLFDGVADFGSDRGTGKGFWVETLCRMLPKTLEFAHVF